jgi:hypothetical protein
MCKKPSLLLVAALILAWGCAQTDTKPMQALLDRLSHGSEADLPSMLYGYKQSSAGAQKTLVGMLNVLRPTSPEQHMKFHGFRQAGRFTMIVAHVAWYKGPYAYEYQPIIVCHEGEQDQVVGYILPFNDILPLIQQKDMESICELSQWYLQEYGTRRGTGP